MQKYAEHALTSEYAKICTLKFLNSNNQVMIWGHLLTACI